jgi:hypothetical protein
MLKVSRLLGFALLSLGGLAVADMTPATAAAVSWRQVTLPGTQIVTITHDPAKPKTLYAGSDTGFVYVSTDAGLTWKGTHLAVPANARVQWILPLPKGVVLASTDAGLFRSTNSGGAFSLSKTYLAGGDLGVMAAPSASSTVYGADAKKGLVRSLDAGLTWKVVKAGVVSAVAVNPSNPKLVYATAGSGDTGQFWTSSNTAATFAIYTIPGGTGSQIALDPSDVNTIYIIGGSAPITVSANGGKTWVGGKFATNPNSGCGPYPHGIAVNPAKTTQVFMGSDCGPDTNGGVWITNDKGKTWKTDNLHMPLGNAYGGVTIVPATAGAPQTIVAAGYGGVARSANGGASFTYSVAGFNEGEGLLITLDPSNDLNLYVAGHWGLYHSANGGKTLSHIAAFGIDGTKIASVAIDPTSKGQSVYVGYAAPTTGASTLAVSKNGGTSWVIRKTPFAASTFDGQPFIKLDPKTRKRLYASGTTSAGTKAYRSDDDGVTWTPLSLPLESASSDALVPNPEVAGELYGLGPNGYARSLDAGKTFATLAAGTPESIAVTGAGSPQALFAELPQGTSGSYAFASSINDGKTWVKGLNPDGKATEAFITTNLKGDPAGDRVFAISGQFGPQSETSYDMYQSINRGKSWTKIASPAVKASLGFGFAWDVTPSQIAIASYSSGLFLSTTKGGPQPR